MTTNGGQNDEGEVVVRLLWVDLDEQPVHFVNQFVVQAFAGEIFLSIGTATPPVILGDTIEERKALAESLGYVPVLPVARVSMTRHNLGRLIEVLQETAHNYDQQQDEGGA